MSAYTVSVVAVTVACATALMIASGTRFEKLCAALTAVAVALCVISPVKEILAGDTEDFTEQIVKDAEGNAERTVISECEEEIERRAAAALAEKYPGVEIKKLRVTVSKKDGSFTVTSYDAQLSGDKTAEADEYLKSLLGLD